MSWLDSIDVASPCQQRWEDMSGDERARFCAACEQTVYRLDDLSRAEAEALARRSLAGDEVCVRFRRRADGTVLTRDCPARLESQRSGWRRLEALAMAALGVLSLGLLSGCTEREPPPDVIMGAMECVEPPPEDIAPVDTKVVGVGRRLPTAG